MGGGRVTRLHHKEETADEFLKERHYYGVLTPETWVVVEGVQIRFLLPHRPSISLLRSTETVVRVDELVGFDSPEDVYLFQVWVVCRVSSERTRIRVR